MKTIRVTIDGKLLLMRQCDDTVTVGEILKRSTRVLDKLKVSTTTAIPIASDLFGNFVEALALEHGVTKGAVLSKRRDGMLPTLRAFVASAWMQVTNEGICTVAKRVGLDHSSCRTALDRIAEWERKDKAIRKMHSDAVALCEFTCSIPNQ